MKPAGHFNRFKIAFLPLNQTFYFRSSWNVNRSHTMAALPILFFAPCVKHRSSLNVIQPYLRQTPKKLLDKSDAFGWVGWVCGCPLTRLRVGVGIWAGRCMERGALVMVGRRDYRTWRDPAWEGQPKRQSCALQADRILAQLTNICRGSGLD